MIFTQELKTTGSHLTLQSVSHLSLDKALVGEVIIRRYASIWYNTVIRGDINRVE